MNQEKIWKAVLAQLEVDLSPAIFKTWFKETALVKIEDGVAEVSCPTYAKKRLEERYYGQIKKALDSVTHQKNELVLKTSVTSKPKNKDQETVNNYGPLFKPKQKRNSSTGLFPQYTFETFVVGPNNNLAHAVARAVVENPGKTYNPFFLHSRVGLGKTHLIQAIGNAIKEKHSDLRIVYCTGESFTNELLDAIRRGDRAESGKFREKFRKSDVWLIDDAQFIAGKESTQEEFFHTFNALYLDQKQIVLTSDRPPQEIARLEERLSSRFSGGMITDMQAPNLDVRVAILRSKRDREGLEVPNEVIDLIAESIPSNIRELEGAFMRVAAIARSQQKAITVDLAKKALGGIKQEKEEKLTAGDIIREVCSYYSVNLKDIKGPRRPKNLALARQVAMYLLRSKADLPFMEIGDVLGGRDHTTIMYGVGKIKNLMDENAKFRGEIRTLESRLR